MTDKSAIDPVLQRRAQASSLANLGKRFGYGLYGVAMLVFFIGLFTSFSSTVSTSIIACIIAGSAILAPAIVTGYAVKAAVRDDLEHGRDIGS
ncbi:MAG: hypothetical protein HOH36_00860 [Acidimicrobiaceae bacterium]|nr:hypothetical protein [Acidimicrobiaceae bacterium]